MLLRIELSEDRASAADDAAKEAMKCKKRAETSRDQKIRAHWAKATLAFAFATEDFSQVHDALLWARRYINDLETTRELYSRECMLGRQALRLLSGTSLGLHTKANVRDSSARVAHGNKIMMHLLDTAIMYQREPSFNLAYFRGAFDLFVTIPVLRPRLTERAYAPRLKFSHCLALRAPFQTPRQALFSTLLPSSASRTPSSSASIPSFSGRLSKK